MRQHWCWGGTNGDRDTVTAQRSETVCHNTNKGNEQTAQQITAIYSTLHPPRSPQTSKRLTSGSRPQTLTNKQLLRIWHTNYFICVDMILHLLPWKWIFFFFNQYLTLLEIKNLNCAWVWLSCQVNFSLRSTRLKCCTLNKVCCRWWAVCGTSTKKKFRI